MFWILLYVIVILALVIEIKFRWKYRSLYKFPGPVDIPLIGAILLFTDETKVIENMFRLQKYFGRVARIALLRQMCLVISDSEMIEFFLRSPKFTTKADNYYLLESWLGKGTFLLPGKEGQKFRKLNTPAFHFSIMKDHVAIFNTHCDVLIDVLRESIDSHCPIDIYPKIGHFTLDIVTETVAGIKTNVQKQSNKEFFDAVHFLTNIVIKRSISLWKRYDFLFRLSPQYKEQQRNLDIVETLSLKAINERRKILQNASADENSCSEEKFRNNIMLDNLLRSSIDGKPIDINVIKTEISGFIFAGHDTTASTISLMMYALANHKDIQDKVVAELKDIFGDDCNRPVNMQDLAEMHYMELVIKEVLRFYGIVPFIGRKLTEDVDYKGTIIPEGTTLVLFFYGLHLSSCFFENPKEFIPERFLPTHSYKPYSFVPFSAGPKNCLGQKYAMNEVKVTFAQLLRHFKFESAGPNYKMKLQADMVMKPTNGVYVKIKPRQF